MSDPGASGGLIGIYGGTFDPVHLGHLRTAQQLRRELPFDEIRMVPAGRPPHRPPPQATAAQRWYMLTRVTGRDTGLVADDRELRRPGPSYAVDTLAELRDELGETRPLAWILGMDAFAGFDRWHRWREIPELAHLVVMTRPGAAPPSEGPVAELLAARRTDHPEALLEAPAGRILVWPVEPLDFSATDIRRCIRSGKQPRFLIPGAVWAYIRREGLYRSAP
jgi:nicotinate-nucleotide adenylyltransferase